MDTISVNFPTNDLREVLEFIAKQYNDNNISARDFKSEYDELLAVDDPSEYSDYKEELKNTIRRHNECVESSNVYKDELISLLEYTEREHNWLRHDVVRDDDFRDNISWLNPDTKRYEDLVFDKSDVASFYLEDGRGMIIKKTKTLYGRDYHDIRFITKSGGDYYVNLFDFDNVIDDRFRDRLRDAYKDQVEAYMVRIQNSERLSTDED
jgi:hypothetical protein